MGDLRKTILGRFGLSVFWSNIWYTNNVNIGSEVPKSKLYEEIFYYIFFWGFSFSPLLTLKHVGYYLNNDSFKLLTPERYNRSNIIFNKSTQGNLLSKISVLNYYTYIALIFYIYIPERRKKNSKNKRIYRNKLFVNSLLDNFK